MRSWGGGYRQELAEFVASELSHGLGWKSAVFLPQDSLALAVNGPRFGAIDTDLVFEDVLRLLDEAYGIVLPRDYWAGKQDMPLGDFIDDLVRAKTRAPIR